MPPSLLYWILLLIWLLGGLWWRWPGTTGTNWGPVVPDLLAFLLFLILGWHAFGPPIRL